MHYKLFLHITSRQQTDVVLVGGKCNSICLVAHKFKSEINWYFSITIFYVFYSYISLIVIFYLWITFLLFYYIQHKHDNKINNYNLLKYKIRQTVIHWCIKNIFCILITI